MDGRRRFLRSVRAAEPGFAPALFGRAAASAPRSGAPAARALARARRRTSFVEQMAKRLSGPLPGLFLGLALFGSIGAYGAVLGGHYANFVAANGEPGDIIARGLGFAINTVTITGSRELEESRILEIAGINPSKSLLFLDVASIRDELETLPLIKRAQVAKLYPGRLLIAIEERTPNAVWQERGRVMVIAADGTVLGAYDDPRFMGLPHIVGPGANKRAAEFLSLLEEAGDLRDKIRAGILVSQRRWTLKMANGIDVHLPEADPRGALATLAQLQRTSQILDKDILALDLRHPGRAVARLSAEAAATRSELSGQKTKPKGGQT